MSMRIRYSYPRLILLFLITSQLLAAGCATTPASHFYLLSITGQESSTATTSTISDQTIIGIGPVRLPEYLDRPQIVSRTDNTELYISDLHRWAEPLEDNFTRVFAEQIARILATDNISIEPSRNRNDLDLRIIIDVIQFDTNQNGEVSLIAYWSVERRDGSKLVKTQKSTIHLDISRNPGHAKIVEGLSRAVYQLARDIAVEMGRG